MVKKQRSFASRSSSSSRPGLERAVLQVDPPGSTADGPDDDAASVLSRSSWGVSWYVETPRFPARTAHTEHRVLSLPLDYRPNIPPPARSKAGDLAGKYGARAVSQVIPRGTTCADGPSPHWAILPSARYRMIDPLGLHQNARWKDPLLAPPVITPG